MTSSSAAEGDVDKVGMISAAVAAESNRLEFQPVFALAMAAVEASVIAAAVSAVAAFSVAAVKAFAGTQS